MDTNDISHQMTSAEWTAWLIDQRCISLEVARAAGLMFRGNELEIPVKDSDGLHLFSKYRRSPLTQEGPKYRYQVGSTAALFGAETLRDLLEGETVLVVEGELDALALRTLGYHTVSSTGGAMTWRQDWEPLLEKFEVVFLYDADPAGVQGALRASGMVHGSKIAWLPVEFGKDPTDVIAQEGLSKLEEAIANAKCYRLPNPGESAARRFEAYRQLAEEMLVERFEQNQKPDGTPFHQDLALEWLDKRIKDARGTIETRRTQGPAPEYASNLENAKAYPIKKLISVNSMGFAKCVFHEERSASMRIYPDNHCYSYCCGKRSDAVDIYRALHSCSFQEAVKSLLA